MARDPRKEGRGKKRGKASASGRRSASGSAPASARKRAAKVVKTQKHNQRFSGHRGPDEATLRNALSEARARQAATAEILKIIANSPSDAKPVFQAIVKSAVELCEARFGAVFRMEGDLLHVVADHSFGRVQRRYLHAMYPMVPNRGHISGRAILDGAAVQIPDIHADEHYKSEEAKRAGFRSLLAAPLLHGSKAIGSIVIFRTEPGDFTESQLALLQAFAAQAVIAIENTRLFHETREALARQAATAEILKIVASSPADAKPVFEAIVRTVVRVLRCEQAFIMRCDDKSFQSVARATLDGSFDKLDRSDLIDPAANFPSRAIVSKKTVYYPDRSLIDHPEFERIVRDRYGVNSSLFLPLLRQDECIGVLALASKSAHAFSASDIALAESFRDQAVIAIENARLFNETNEALERQTATSEILQAISSSLTDVTAVFETILDKSVSLCSGDRAVIWQFDGQALRLVAGKNTTPEAMAYLRQQPLELGTHNPTSLAALERRIVHELDAFANPAYRPLLPIRTSAPRAPTVLAVPLVRQDGLLGVITIWRHEKRAFTDKQIQLVETFASQAVIAIENTRLFNETNEALAQQTATSEVLEVISSSVGDVQPVFDQMLEKATQVCGAEFGVMGLLDGEMYRRVALHNVPPVYDATVPREFRLLSETPNGTARDTRRVFKIDDLSKSDWYISRASPSVVAMVEVGHVRTLAVVPMLKDGEPIGTISIFRQEVRPFSDRQIELLRNFANQAVIAIENARLFNETNETLERQTATADILKVIAGSPTDVQPVFEAIAESAKRLLGSHTAVVTRVIDDVVHLAASTSESEAPAHAAQGLLPYPVSSDRIHARVIRTGQIAVSTDAPNSDLPQEIKDFARTVGWSSMLVVPMLRNQVAIGTIAITRREPGSFDDKTVDLLKTFANQAVIAIENARLFNETSEALERQTATADILKVIAGSPSDVQPVFEAIASSANRLLGGHSTAVTRVIDGNLYLAAFTPVSPEADAVLASLYPMPTSVLPFFAKLERGEPYQEPDMEAIAFEQARQTARARGYRSMLFVPLMNAGQVIGLVGVSRVAPGTFAPEEVQLLQTFANQAVIAIENARLFNETSEALAQQTATSEVLEVISSSMGDAQPVFEKMLENAARVCGAEFGIMGLFEGDIYRRVALYNVPPIFLAVAPKDFLVFDQGPIGSVRQSGQIFRSDDFRQSEAYLTGYAPSVAMVDAAGVRTLVIVPMLRDGKTIGVISIYRTEVRPFSDKQVELLKNFANQAVIAIENARLFNETREALERQTATSEVLQVISSSPGDLKPVFDQMLAKAMRLCEAQCGFIYQMEQGAMRAMAEIGVPPAFAEYRRHNLHTGGAATPVDVMRATRKPAHVHDARDSEPYRSGNPNAVAGVDLGGARTVLYVPMIRNDDIVGVINLYRQEVKPFTDEQIALLENFASQAVIAIENARLFNETREALAQQTATSEVLSVISNSVADTAPVFEKILDSCEKLFATEQLGIFIVQPDGQTLVGAWRGAAVETVIRDFPRPVEETATGVVIRNRSVLHIANTATAKDAPASVRHGREQVGDFSIAWAPMLTEEGGIGSISVMRQPPNPFSEKELALLKTFADQAVIAIQNTRMFNDTREALARQTATADVLKVIASSPSNLQPVFDAIAERSNELINGHSTTVFRFVGDTAVLTSFTPVSPEADAVLTAAFPRPITADPHLMLSHRGEMTEVDDTESERFAYLNVGNVARARGWRSRLMVPLNSDNGSIGVISVTRKEPGKFADKNVELLQTFADQAVIAIQNVELFEEVQARTRDLQESLQQQTATADVLKVISRSIFDLNSVLDTLLSSAARLCGADRGVIFQSDGNIYPLAASYGFSAEFEEFAKANPISIDRGTITGRVVLGGKTVHIHDVLADADYTGGFRQFGEFRTALGVPLLRDGKVDGVMSLSRSTLGPFTDRQIELAQTFADQAVIAIENTRLFNETKEALARQTATADVLKVIASSPSNLQPVFDTIAERSKALIGAHSTVVIRYIGGQMELAAFTPVSPEADAAVRAMFPRRPSPDDPQNVQVLRGEIAQIADAESDFLLPSMRDVARARGWRSRLLVPLKDDTGVIGWISITRKEAGGFTDKDVELLKTFADQAVIAIQNVELFEEVQAKTRDLEESLQQQTATADVLKVISRSAFDLDSVMNTLARSAAEVCGATRGALWMRDGDRLVAKGIAVDDPATLDFLIQNPVLINSESHMGRAVLTGTVRNIPDILNSETNVRKFQQAFGFRSLLAVPLMREGRAIGVFTLDRDEVGIFSARQVELVQSFADQAVIAIENTRLFDETTEALERQTATADILKVIASSPDDVQPVFQAIADRSNRLVEALSTTVFTLVDGMMHLRAFTPVTPQADARLQATFPAPLSTFSWGDAIGRGEIYRVVDAEQEPESLRDLARERGWRSALIVPLLRDGRPIGTIGPTRAEPGPFSDHHVQLMQTFADQAVIAISNVELFQEVQKRTRELSQSLDDLRAAQDRLVQTEKLASLGQLTAGIAHEIKNPLNFINNFSALSVELTDELNDVLGKAELAEKLQRDINELTQLLKSNLEKVVQHGKRADSIVKNMLLHSREGSGEQRAADINSLVEESLNLAYHGARAEKSGFNITLQREFDTGAGSAELFPQEITRALLNLISNGFYAATRRKAENGDGGFEPTLLARTRDLGGSVEIRIRDNGTGIPPEVKEKMFNPFFTTKPAGEGTGLGLSMTHDIIVKQHGGTIDVATEPGSFTEFIVVLPRANGVPGKSKGQA
jgi:GAF domain-containing protein